MKKTLMLIDGHSMAFRAFFALPVDNFSTTGGQTTNAVYGFLSMLSNILSEEKPTHVAVAFDVARETFRNEIFPEYKAQREKTPEEFRGQVPLIQQVLKEMGIVTLEKDNYEADDIIATLATQAKPEGFETLIVTGDRDSFQLVNDTTTVLYPMRGVTTLHRFTPAAIEKKYGLTPTQYPDFAALRGDPSDNLPGIPGVGEKTATKWIVQYGTLANLIDHADEIRGKVGDNFRERVANVQLNRDITEMVKDLPLPYGPNELELRPADAQGIIDFFDRLEFGDNLRERVFRTLSIEGAGVTASTSDSATKLEAVSLDDGALAAWLDNLHEPAALQVGEHTLMIGSADEKGKTSGQAVSLDLGDLSAEDADALREWLAGDHPKLVHDSKTAMHALWNYDFELAGVIHDTFLAAYLLRPSQRSYSLDNVVQRHLGQTLSQAEGQMTLLDGPAEDASHVAAVIDLAERLAVELDEAGLYSVYADLEVPLAPVLGRMERAGIAVDVDALEELRKQAQAATDEAESEARNLVDKPELNLGSPKQLQEVLFDQLGMPKTKKTKTGYSTAAKEIEGLAKVNPHPFLDYLLKFRESQKMKSTVEGLIKAVADDGRIHTTFNQAVAATGRLSSTEPNLQNIPVRTEFGRRIREAFVVGDGYEQLITADYSQIEMRVMAHLSQDPGLIEAYRQGEDLHNYVGSKVFGVGIDEVTPELRRRVKAMSYGLAYGLSAFGLAQQLDIPQREAKKLMEDYFERFGGVRDYLHKVVEQARKDGFTATMFDRRRYLPELNADNRIARDNAERAALNSPIQGSAADIIKIAMLRVDDALRRGGLRSRVLLQVHDELVVEVADGEEEAIKELLHREMDSAAELLVPLDVSIGAGVNWDTAAH
ncbi:DNA polymerase I [Corynebacterium sp. HMSC063G05]|uniref:DNA polymerase I n=1 Tax=Corynebacterium sp. HMSC063G05 TaxID=1739255 RepID=UPI0008A5ABAC|nr:DNA polymerase I [Corynebacterium sp. HMSC063G05]OFL71072.1 DNA polymerase I [Corynebacterium sp. HMSC063G05]